MFTVLVLLVLLEVLQIVSASQDGPVPHVHSVTLTST